MITFPLERMNKGWIGEADHERIEVGEVGIRNALVGSSQQAPLLSEWDGWQVEEALRAAKRPRINEPVWIASRVCLSGPLTRQSQRHGGCHQWESSQRRDPPLTAFPLVAAASGKAVSAAIRRLVV